MKPGLGERVAQVLLALVKAACYLSLFLGAQMLVMMPVVVAHVVQAKLNDRMVDQEWITVMLVEQAMKYSLIANLVTLSVVLVFYLVRRKKLGEALWLKRADASTLWAGVALTPGMHIVVTLVLSVLPESWMESYSEASSSITSGGVIGALAVAVAAPVVEEIIFRGLIMTRLSEAMPGWLAVLLSAAIFGACHGHPVWFGYAFVLGAVFGFLDLGAGSIWPSILAHVVFNSIDQIGELLPENDLAYLTYFGFLLILAVVLPILGRKAIAATFRRVPRGTAVPYPSDQPGMYEFDPWDD